jgi:endonuclease G
MDEVWVVTGPIFDDDIEKLASGVEIPDAFYKIIADDRPSFRAYIIPQGVAGSEKIEQFIVTVDSIESVTHLDFFWELDDALEDSLERIR